MLDLIEYIFFLGLILLAFGTIWNWIFALFFSMIFALFNSNKFYWIPKLIGAYILISLCAELTTILLANKSILEKIFYHVIGAFILFINFTSNTQKAKIAQKESFYAMNNSLNYDTYITYGSILLFIISSFIPQVFLSEFSKTFINTINVIIEVRILGLLIKILGIYYILTIFWRGFRVVNHILKSQ